MATEKRAAPPGAAAADRAAVRAARPGFEPRMIRIVAAFGAPVTEAHGKSAREELRQPARRSRPRPSTSSARRSDSARARTGARPRRCRRSAMRPRSLRTMSTIIRFSARSFAEAASSAAMAPSSAANRPRERVPFIGRMLERGRLAARRRARARARRPPSRRPRGRPRTAPRPGRARRRTGPRGSPAKPPRRKDEIDLVGLAGRDRRRGSPRRSPRTPPRSARPARLDPRAGAAMQGARFRLGRLEEAERRQRPGPAAARATSAGSNAGAAS